MAIVRVPVRHAELWPALRADGALELGAAADDGALVGRPFRILLAEDNSVNQMVAQQMLRKLGCSADVASDGAQAVALVRQQDYDVVFMDIQMPGMDGLTATRNIRAANDVAQPYIVAMTANAMATDRESCRDAGMDDFVPKPVRIDEIKAALQRASGRLSLAPAPAAAAQGAQPAAPLS